jgi:hypothetical protein
MNDKMKVDVFGRERNSGTVERGLTSFCVRGDRLFICVQLSSPFFISLVAFFALPSFYPVSHEATSNFASHFPVFPLTNDKIKQVVKARNKLSQLGG